MTYEQILAELDAVGIKDEFQLLYESLVSDKLLQAVKSCDKIYSTGAIISNLINYLPYESDIYFYWVKVLHYFMTPVFFRPKSIFN